MSNQDGPKSSLFAALTLQGNMPLAALADIGISPEMAAGLDHAPRGAWVSWGIPFEIRDVVALADQTVSVDLAPTTAPWLIFMHTSDMRPIQPGSSEFISPMRGEGRLGEHAADYVIVYADGNEERLVIRRRHHLGTFQRRWGENCFEAVAHHKPHPRLASHEQTAADWGWSQTPVSSADGGSWVNWLWAWEKPYPDREIIGIRFEPVSGLVNEICSSAAVSVRTWSFFRRAISCSNSLILPSRRLVIGSAIAASCRSILAISPK